MDKTQAEALAIAIVKSVVNCLSQKEYGKIFDFVNSSALSAADIAELVDGFLEANGQKGMDAFGVECTFTPNYNYRQIEFYFFNDKTGFAVDYDLTTNGERNDLTLQMKFLYNQDNSLTSNLLDLHVL